MNRKIKFRSWLKLENKMLNKFGIVNNDESSETSRRVLMQYTGLKDKNGVEIYEGDILTSEHYPFQDDGEYNYHGLVEWGDEEAAFYLTKYLASQTKRGISHGISELLGQDDMATFEIIGNIYEHPHLLEVAERG